MSMDRSDVHHAADTGEDHPHPKHELGYYAKRIYAIRDLLIEKGVLTQDDIQRQIADPKATCAEMGMDATSINEFVVLENTEKVRHLVVCTLCSCYPRPILGRAPDWHKSLNDRSGAGNAPAGGM